MESYLLVSTGDRSKGTGRRIAIKPSDPSKQSFVLVLETVDNQTSGRNINCTARFQPASTFDASHFRTLLNSPIYGCVGLVQVDNEPFVCVITDCSVVGDIEQSSRIYRINNVMFFSLTTDTFDSLADNGASFIRQKELSSYQMQSLDDPADQFETLKHPCQSMQRFFNSGSFYFSYDFDLTRRAQDRYCTSTTSTDPSNETRTVPNLWETADPRFFWNKYVIKELLRFREQLPPADQAVLDQDGILVMLTNGFIRIDDVPGHNQAMKIVMISRLSCMRAGTRFNTRGIDDDGSVANNVETELLIYKGPDICISYVIIRGSVPIFWEQQGLQLGGHKIQITRSEAATQPAFDRHFYELVEQYGKQHIVNLLGQKEQSAELQLTQAYRRHFAALGGAGDNVRMTNFDFHLMVKGNQYDNLNSLVDELRNSITMYGAFAINRKTGKIISTQQGTFRVNCLDCLDRTNVVQGMICKASLEQCLKQAINIDALYTQCLNDIWADNGDELSRIYTGTGALKSGFTRTGKRTLAGFMDDARKTATRFYVNNFQDKSKQEVIDTILGKLPNQAEIQLHNPVQEAVIQALNTRFSEYASKTTVRVHVGTWNVNAKHPQNEPLVPWLTFDQNEIFPDILVVGFQEIVELNAQQIMATDMGKRKIWEDLVVKTINSLPGIQANPFVTLRSGQLVGAALCIFVRQNRIPNIRSVDSAIKKTGLAGLAGNKGGIAIRMDLFDLSLCFVCAHLAAGQSNIDERNRDYETISDGLTFNKGRKISNHDVVVWLGDFNYRIDLDNEDVRARVAKNELNILFKADQLNTAMQKGRVFQGFREAPIRFHPTYKYDNNSAVYDSSEKNRIPAWTDRILVSGNPVKILKYDRSELMTSDHRPVKAMIELEAPIINQVSKEKLQKELYQKFAAQAVPLALPPRTNMAHAKSRDNVSQIPKTAPAPVPQSEKVGLLIDLGDNASATVPVTNQTLKAPDLTWWDDPVFSGTTPTPQNQQNLSIGNNVSPPKNMPSAVSNGPPPLPQRSIRTGNFQQLQPMQNAGGTPQQLRGSTNQIQTSNQPRWDNLDLFSSNFQQSTNIGQAQNGPRNPINSTDAAPIHVKLPPRPQQQLQPTVPAQTQKSKPRDPFSDPSFVVDDPFRQ